MADYGNSTIAAPSAEKGSRIQSDTHRLMEMVNRIKTSEQRIVRHAMSLGYYSPQPESAGNKPTPVSSSLADALSDLDRALDGLSGALNLFD